MKLITMMMARAAGLSLKQDPCAGCNEALSLKYQGCARDHGNPCAERNAAGLVSDAEGTKKDVKCCLVKEKHDRCMECRSMNCAYKTCNVNDRYYREHATVMKEKASTKEAYAKYDQKAMEAA